MPRSLLCFAVLSLLALPAASARASDSHDLASFTTPPGWTRAVQGSVVRLTQITQSDGTYCQVNLYRSTPSTGTPEGDFRRDWQELVVAPFNIRAAPGAVSRPDLRGWQQRAGKGTYLRGQQQTFVTLVTYRGGGATVSVLTLANHPRCETAFAAFFTRLSLRGPTAGSAAAPSGPPPASAAAVSRFDDGWQATVRADWVEVEKGPIRVYLYFALPYDASQFSGTGVVARDHYWQRYVAQTFRTGAGRYRDEGEFIGSLKPPYVEGWGVDPRTGERRFVAATLGLAPGAALLTVATAASEQALRQTFPRANDRSASDLAAMSRYNKFALRPRELVGRWQSGASQSAFWYDARTGAYAGATLAASSATFVFQPGGAYRSVHNGATGAVGAMQTFQQQYRGRYEVSSFALTATGRYQGRTDTFDAHFQAVRGGRLLWLDDRRGGRYLLVRTGGP